MMENITIAAIILALLASEQSKENTSQRMEKNYRKVL